MSCLLVQSWSLALAVSLQFALPSSSTTSSSKYSSLCPRSHAKALIMHACDKCMAANRVDMHDLWNCCTVNRCSRTWPSTKITNKASRYIFAVASCLWLSVRRLCVYIDRCAAQCNALFLCLYIHPSDLGHTFIILHLLLYVHLHCVWLCIRSMWNDPNLNTVFGLTEII